MSGVPTGGASVIGVPAGGEQVDLLVGGMTCASCAARIEKKLNRMPGVEATVNYATEKASVFVPKGTTVAQAIAVIEETGYTAERPQPPQAPHDQTAPGDAPSPQDLDVAALKTRLILSALLALPVLLMSAIPPLQFTNWQWLALTLGCKRQ